MFQLPEGSRLNARNICIGVIIAIILLFIAADQAHKRDIQNRKTGNTTCDCDH